MKLYLIYDKDSLRNLLLCETIMKPNCYKYFYDFKKQVSENEHALLFFNKVPRNIIDDKKFILEVDINLKKVNYTKMEENYIIYDNLYLDSGRIKLKKIYYQDINLYEEFIREMFFVREVKSFKKYKSKMKKIEHNDILFSDKSHISKCLNVCTMLSDEMEFKKSQIYDSLKGMIVMTNYFYPINIVQSKKEESYFKNIAHVEKRLKALGDFNNNKDIICELSNKKSIYLNKLKKEILNNSKHSVSILKNNKIKLNYNTNLMINDEDLKIIENIISSILITRCSKSDTNDLDRLVIEQFGKGCKESFGELIYEDAKKLYALIVNRKIEFSYKEINSEVIRFLYLALEYRDNIGTINAIVGDYKFERYPIIYSFIGAMIGFRRLDKMFYNENELDVFQIKQSKQFKEILELLDNNFELYNYYRKQNLKIINNLIKQKNYYKMVKKYCLYRDDDSIYIKRLRKSMFFININNEFKIKISIKKNGNLRPYTYKNGILQNTQFNRFSYCYLNGKKLTYYDESRLNDILRKIQKDIS